jgi:hypothetical protein
MIYSKKIKLSTKLYFYKTLFLVIYYKRYIKIFGFYFTIKNTIVLDLKLEMKIL